MKTTIAAAFLAVTMTGPAALAQSAGAACDRACLLSTADAYVAALVAHDIHEIEAMGFTLPLFSKNGWSPFMK